MYFLINQKKIILLWAVLVVVLSYAFDKADAQIAGYDITINQLHLLNYADSVYFSPIALISLGYWPDVDDYYVNITALDASQQPQWVVRNLYLPDLTWIDTPQTIATRFTMEMLGVAAGEEVTSLEIAIVTSEGVLDQMPVGGQFYLLPVDTLAEYAQGEVTDVPFDTPPIDDYLLYPEVTPFDTVTSLEFRGCRVPNIDLNDSLYPDSPQYAGDWDACGPAAAANSIKWLDSVSTQITIPENLRDVMTELSALMNRARNSGVTISQFLRGKLDFFQIHNLSINVKFQSYFLSGNVFSSDGTTYARNDSTDPYPTWTWLKQQMDDQEDVEICFHWWDGEMWRGHAVVLTGAEITATGDKAIKFKHDVKQQSAGGTMHEAETVFVDSLGRMILRSRKAFIGSVIAESPGNPYPIELKDFNAAVTADGVQLTWETISETNNYGFVLFRGGRHIAFIRGRGTSIEPATYTYLDENSENGRFYYELFQIDTDGTREKVSDLFIEVNTIPSKFFLAQNYPNPFSGGDGATLQTGTYSIHRGTTITFGLPEETNVTIALYSVTGRLIEVLMEEKMTAGKHALNFNAGSLASGIYIYTINTDKFSASKKMTILR